MLLNEQVKNIFFEVTKTHRGYSEHKNEQLAFSWESKQKSMRKKTLPEWGDRSSSSLRVSLLVMMEVLAPPGTTPTGWDMTMPWSSTLSSKLPMRAFLIMSSRPRLLAGSAKEWPLALTEPEEITITSLLISERSIRKQMNRPQTVLWFTEYTQHSGTSVLVINSFQSLWRVPKPTSTQWWSIVSCGVASWLTQVLASVIESWASAQCWNFFFLPKYDKYKVWQVLRLMSTEVWLYLASFLKHH